MQYPGATPAVQAHLYKCICQPTLTYGLECMSHSAAQMQKLESAQGKLIKQSLGLSKRSHNTALLRALSIEKVYDIVNRNVLSLYHRIFKVESPARRLMQYFLAHYITSGSTVPGTLLDRVVALGKSPLTLLFRQSSAKKNIYQNHDGNVDSIRHLLSQTNFIKANSYEHFLVHLLTTAL